MSLKLDTLFIGRNFIKFKEIDSTNSYLKERAETENLPEGTVVSSEYQTNGRGQRGTSWESSAGKNIMISVLLHPKFISVSGQFLLSQAIALALHDFVSFYFPQNKVLIKWPNDILIDQKKVAGILIENNLQGSFLKNSVIGMGININEENFPYPNATSFKKISKLNYDIETLISKLLSCIEARYLQLKQGISNKIETEYLDKLFGYKEKHLFLETGTGEEFSGKITGISKEGKLRLLKNNDLLKEYYLKEIKFLNF